MFYITATNLCNTSVHDVCWSELDSHWLRGYALLRPFGSNQALSAALRRIVPAFSHWFANRAGSEQERIPAPQWSCSGSSLQAWADLARVCLIAMLPSTPMDLGWLRKPGFNRGNTVLALGPEKCAWRIQMDRMNTYTGGLLFTIM